MDDKENIEKYWKNFRSQASMVVGYESAVIACTDFMDQYGQATTEDVEENAQGIRVVAHLIRKFEATEDYVSCAKLSRFQQGLEIPEGACEASDLPQFLSNFTTVLLHDVNCQGCWTVLEDNGMTIIQQLNIDTDEGIDGLALVEILHNYFLIRGEIGKCPFLKLLKNQLSETKQNQITKQ
ncbi:MAG: hypothetical protein EYC69_11725 [Bacteroidetes bacterium]|nr:MAG: hypothetical protein EYC69_11725 [Bacteroidota bacterium]